jgi:hypothetical protein
MRKLMVLALALSAGGAAIAAYVARSQLWPGRELSDAEVWGAVPAAELPDAPWLDFQPQVKQPGYRLTPVGDGSLDDVRCSSYGAVFGSAPYIQCRAQLDAARIIARRAQ